MTFLSSMRCESHQSKPTLFGLRKMKKKTYINLVLINFELNELSAVFESKLQEFPDGYWARSIR